jgi:hypothetical protein
LLPFQPLRELEGSCSALSVLYARQVDQVLEKYGRFAVGVRTVAATLPSCVSAVLNWGSLPKNAGNIIPLSVESVHALLAPLLTDPDLLIPETY